MMREAVPIARFRGGTVVDLLRWRADGEGDARLVTFLRDGERDEATLTYAELDARARAIAVAIGRRAAPGERALLLYAGGIEFITGFFGCLYAGVVAVPAYPPEPERLERTLQRLTAIAVDARPSLVLSTREICALKEPLSGMSPELAALDWLATDAVPCAEADGWRDAGVTPATVALLQYTSGSTADPKGVIVTHDNLLYTEEMIRRGFEHQEGAVGVGWLPLFHDMGLMGNLLQPLYAGFPCVLMSPIAFLQRPARWLEAISTYGATTSGGPNFAYELCLRRVTEEQRAHLDLRRWDVAFSGAEPVSASTIERFVRTFAPCGFRREAFYPCYGMAEATLIITGGAKAAEPVLADVDADALQRHRAIPPNGGGSRRVVGCGRPLADERVLVVDPDRRAVVSDGEVGEVWVAGRNVARGYWQRAEQSAAVFHATLAESDDGPYLRTGDLAFVRDGELFVTGRIKDVIIIRGRNFYPQDLELTVASCDHSLRPGSGAAFAVEVDDQERLAVVNEVRRECAGGELARVVDAIREAIAVEHGVQLHAVMLIEAGTIPKTSSGKIRRGACRDLYLRSALIERCRWVQGAGFAPRPGSAAPPA
jgi:acyl-CoA synthetase (AMP-forming)/AMP-acid ligase II